MHPIRYDYGVWVELWIKLQYMASYIIGLVLGGEPLVYRLAIHKHEGCMLQHDQQTACLEQIMDLLSLHVV